MPTVYQAREREATAIPISEIIQDNYLEILPQVQGHAYFDVRLAGKELILTAGKYIGLIPLNDRVSINVEAKTPLGNLIQILARADGDIVELRLLERHYRESGTVPRSLFDAMAEALVRSLQRVESDGFSKRYEEARYPGLSLKGHVDFAGSIRAFWGRGLNHRAVSSYYDLSADTRDNRILRFACYSLLRNYHALGVEGGIVASLHHFNELFTSLGVTLHQPEWLRATKRGGKEDVYDRALRMALAILSQKGVELQGEGSDFVLPSFLVDMETVFEKYVLNVLKIGLIGYRVMDGNREGGKALFDDRHVPQANPDIVVTSAAGFQIVGDVKYKAHATRNDINQVLTYALSYRVNRAVLVLPVQAQKETEVTLIGEVQGIYLYRYDFNLAADNLEEEERAMCSALEQLTSTSGTNLA